ncbi:MAG: cobalamin B12-binding domain-containing protein [Coriobacteriia bacterium]|nr:cobalamin B12-binding domain-containing protein [Coriobacteriia bacterium]
MRVLLARPGYGTVYRLLTRESKQRMVFPPMGLMTLGAVLESAGHDVSIVDCEAERLDAPGVVDRASSFGADFVGCSSTTPEFHIASRILGSVKSELGLPTVLGGPHATVCAEEVLASSPHIDYTVRGEGERTLVELVERLAASRSVEGVEGLSYREGGVVTHNACRDPIPDLDTLPLPAWHLVEPKAYMVPCSRSGMKMCGTVQTSRGCPYDCAFCYPMFGRRVRYKSVRRVLDEIALLLHECGVEWLYFVDENVTIDATRMMAICEGMVEEGLDVPWQCLARADSIRDEMLVKMRAAGCVQVSLGVESGSQRVLDLMRKSMSLATIDAAFERLRAGGFETRGSFVIGLPGDDKSSIRETIEFAKRLKIDRASFNIFTPYPGTRVLEDPSLKQLFHILSDDWSQYTRHGNAVVELPGVTREELMDLQRVANMEFYTSWWSIRHHAKAFLRGDRQGFYYRPLVFALRERLVRLGRRLYRLLVPHVDEKAAERVMEADDQRDVDAA